VEERAGQSCRGIEDVSGGLDESEKKPKKPQIRLPLLMMAPKQQQDDDKNRQGGEIGKKSVVHQVCFLAQASFCKEGPSEPADGIAFLALIIEQMQPEGTKNLS
jgi:hypothetical protein